MEAACLCFSRSAALVCALLICLIAHTSCPHVCIFDTPDCSYQQPSCVLFSRAGGFFLPREAEGKRKEKKGVGLAWRKRRRTCVTCTPDV
eukprot:scaffold78346_cov23-Tisochrysis_lutea.AAC.1